MAVPSNPQASNTINGKASTQASTSPVDPQTAWKAVKFAVKFSPPCIFLEYQDSSLQKRVREVKLSRVSPDVDADRLTRKVIRSFPRQLDAASVKYDQVRKLVAKVLEHMQRQLQLQQPGGAARDGDGTRGPSDRHTHAAAAASGGLSRPPLTTTSMPHLGHSLSPTLSSLAAQSARAPRQSMDSEDRFSTSTVGGERLSGSGEHGGARGAPGGLSGLDLDLDSALHELDQEFGAASAASGSSRRGSTEGSCSNAGFASGVGSVTSSTSVMAAAQRCASAPALAGLLPAAPSRSRFAEEVDRLVLDVDVEGDVDLNKVTDMELKLAKMKMEQEFIKHQLRPGDGDYEYDKQVEFAPATEVNDWDESGDEEDEEGGAALPAPGKAAEPAPATQHPLKAPTGALSIQVQSGAAAKAEDDDDDDDSFGDQQSETSPQSVQDDVSPRRVAIDTDSSLELP